MLSLSRKYFAVFRKLSPTLSARITEGLNKRTGKFSQMIRPGEGVGNSEILI